MDKYLSIEIVNLQKKISDAILESGLPSCVSRMVLFGILTEVAALSEREYQNDLQLQKSNKKQV